MIDVSSTPGETTLVPNLEYNTWVQQDQIILSTIISFLFESLVAHVVGLPTAHAIWTTLDCMFSSQSKASIMQVLYHLSTIKRGTLFIFHQPLRAAT